MEVSASTIVFIVLSALCHLCLLSHLNNPTSTVGSSTVRVLALCRYRLCIFHGVSVPGITWRL